MLQESVMCRNVFQLVGVLHIITTVTAGPLTLHAPSSEVANNSLTDFELPSASRGCRYKALFYSNGEEVSTEEPCLHCQCKGTVVVCKLRICPEIPVPPPPGCIVVHKAKQCCSQLVCYSQDNPIKKISREQRLSIDAVLNETLLGSAASDSKEQPGYCVLDGTVYAEGSAMRSSTLCQYCFCIRGEMKCSSPQCVIPLNGCKPKFRSYACCPTNYDCGESNATAVLKTMPSSTQVPQFLKGCLVNNQFVPEGEPVLPMQLAGSVGNGTSTNVCQTCFCMGGVVHCRPLECDHPIDGCTPIKEDGHCCPDRYDCSKRDLVKSERSSDAFGGSGAEVMTTTNAAEVESTTVDTVMYVPVGITTLTTFADKITTEDTLHGHADESFERVVENMAGSSEEMNNQGMKFNLKKTRVSMTTVGGFKNRSDLGSREERRSKDGDDLTGYSKQSLQQSFEDDEREDEYFGNMGIAEPLQFETTMSNVADELGGATTIDLDDGNLEESTFTPSSEQIPEYESSTVAEDAFENVSINQIAPEEEKRDKDFTTIVPTVDSITDIPTTEESGLNDKLRNEDSSMETRTTVPEVTTPTQDIVTKEGLLTSSAPSPTTTSSEPLEFIPFVEDDAFAPKEDSPHAHETDAFDKIPLDDVPSPESAIALLKPLLLRFFNGTAHDAILTGGSSETMNALPLLVENDETEIKSTPPTEFNLDVKPTEAVEKIVPPISSSFYNNGFYPHGSIILDDESSAEELHVSKGELSSRQKDNSRIQENFATEKSTPATPSTTFAPTTTTITTTKLPEVPLKAINSVDKFIPSYNPAAIQNRTDLHDTNPARTYSKFGIQDAPLYRYEYNTHSGPPPALDSPRRPSSSGIYHHRYYNEPEEIPRSPIQSPYNFFTSDRNRQHPTKHGVGVAASPLGVAPPIFNNKNNQFFYDDTSAPLDSWEEYDTYVRPPNRVAPYHTFAATTPRVVSTTSRTESSPFQFLGERVRMPSYNQQRATSTPKYKYAHFNTNRGTTYQVSSTERPTPVQSGGGEYKQFQSSFPFNLPREEDNNILKHLGIKLSGCNVVGKMYSIGEVIEELSSDCLKCICSDIGVHCSELKC